MNSVRQFFLAVALSIMGLTASAQTVETTPNLVTNIRASSGHGVWLGTGGNSQLGGVHPIELWGCCTSYSGSNPFFDTSTTNGNGQSGQIIWSFGNATVNHIVAINQALSSSGVQINGYNWSYDLRNNNGGSGQSGVDTLTATSRLWNSTYNSVLLQQSRTHNTRIDWTTFSSTVTAATPHPLANVGNLQLEFRSADSGFWGGYYGPQIRDVRASFNYTAATVDPCVNDPLSSPACTGYAQAFFNQQCSANPLYNSGCPGYAQALLTQQCNANSLFSVSCPGYATAYYDYQCSVSALYHPGCSGHAAAYFDQQCLSNPLYSNQCAGYADAYYVQQCTANALYDSGCTGYDAAYLAQQCSINTLYHNQCPGYDAAYFDQQCSLDALHSNQCPDYAQAYAKKYILPSNAAPVAVTEATPTPEPVAIVAAASSAASASPADSTAPVQLVSSPAAAATAPAATTTTAPAAESAPPAARTTRQALAERRMAAAQAAVAQSARNNAGAMSQQMDSAASMEQQVELQNVVLGAMGFVAGFDAYGRATLPDAAGYRPFEIYQGQRNVDSAAARGLLGRSDRLHSEMVNSQYNK